MPSITDHFFEEGKGVGAVKVTDFGIKYSSSWEVACVWVPTAFSEQNRNLRCARQGICEGGVPRWRAPPSRVPTHSGVWRKHETWRFFPTSSSSTIPLHLGSSALIYSACLPAVTLFLDHISPASILWKQELLRARGLAQEQMTERLWNPHGWS